jgi:putative ABC transport system ATP-binding protein
MIEVKDLKKFYKDDETITPALGGVSFSIKKGEFVAIMGPSGSGKSTLMHILSFLDRPTGGSYSFLGQQMDDLSDKDLARVRNENMGFVFQAFNLLPSSSVYENVELPLIYSQVSPTQRKTMVEEAVAAVGLSEKIKLAAGKLSGGQKQRVAIARALVNNPDIVFADEPTGNLDSVSGAQVMDIFKKLNESGRTVILVTHETYTAQFANRLIRLRDGRVEVDEPITDRRNGKEEFFK